MRNIKRKISLVCVTSLLLSVLTFSTVFGADSKSMIESITNDYLATSLQYAVISNDKIIKSGNAGVYSKTENKALTADTMYGTGSVSKIFTTVAVMKLVEQGKVNLDSPVTTYIPAFKMADERYKNITVRMLLNHSSGLLGSTLDSAFLLDDVDSSAKDQLLNKLTTQRLKADPGAFSVYCNDGFTLSEIIVEMVSGQTFTDFIHTYITTPLNMPNTKTPVDNFDRNQLARIYQGVTVVPPETTNVIGAGGVYSTAEDMCKFAQIFMNNSTVGRNILSKSSTEAMASKEYLNGIWPEEEKGKEGMLSYGLGWDNVNGQAFLPYNIQELTKGGDTLYYHGVLVVLPEKNMAAVVLSSGAASTYNQLLAEELLKEALIGNKEIPNDPIEPINLTALSTTPTPVAVAVPNDLLQYEGYYASISYPTKVDINEDGTLVLSIPEIPGQSQTFYYNGNNKFTDKTGLAEVTFVKESNGLTYIQTTGLSIFPGLGTANQNLYSGQKVENNPLDETTAASWASRSNKTYFLVNEKASSAMYLAAAPMAWVPDLKNPKGLAGYIASNKIIDKDNAKNMVQIPGLYGRDLQDMKFFKENAVEYLSMQGNIAVSEDDVSMIYNGKNATCTIGEKGYARWYKINAVAGKTISVNVPKNASFTVYEDNTFTYSSMLDSKKTVKLPKSGHIVFAGKAGSKFTMTIN